ncbi:hypothetical protein Bca52824_034399 [Brassica carinata]|uniref:PGG domain-containing protein n=1 Tax=Brassica carinata TaxID=52824 RepID=A0A8X7S1H8_BRACI|nr:hypothetical protein Bca52824_034399 [Brassica carinata]
MLKHDPSLACVKGRNGLTPFHFLVVSGNADLVAECLNVSPECIEDVCVNGQNALHLAVMNDRLEVLQVLTGGIQRMSQRNAFNIEIRFLNKEDFSYNTALHLAAYKDDLQAVRLLLKCQLVERNTVNGDGLTFLDILRNLENAGDWDLDLEQVVLKTRCKEAASMPKAKAVSEILKSPFTLKTCQSIIAKRMRSNTSEEVRGALLIVFTLIITATYQTALQPPGGEHPSKDPPSSKNDLRIKQAFLLLLCVFNTMCFYCALFNICRLLPRKPHFNAWFMSVETYLGVCYALAVAENSPDPLSFFAMTCAIVQLYLTYIALLELVGRKIYRTVAGTELEKGFIGL